MTHIRRTLPGQGLRNAAFTREIDEEARTVELAFSSDAAVERYFGLEILGHDDGEIDLSRVDRGVMPLLLDHDTREQVGRIESVSIESGVGRAVARFSRGARGEEVFRDVVDGIRTGVSVGYLIHGVRLESEEEDVATYRVTRWEPFEVSLVSVPADVTVGVGRAAGETVREIPVEGLPESADRPADTPPAEDNATSQEENRTMTTATNTPAPAATPATPSASPSADRSPDDIARAERARISAITALGARHNRSAFAAEHVNAGTSEERFRGLLLDQIGDTPLETPASTIGMADREAREFSLFRALRAAGTNDWRNAGLEREALDACADHMRRTHNREARGMFIPFDVLAVRGESGRRDLTAGGSGTGAELVGTDHMAGSFIDALRNRMMVRALGATVMSGLVGDVDIPKLSAGGTAYWLAAENTTVTESNQTTAQVQLSPNTVAARTDVSRRLLLQSSPDAENMVRNDLATVLALAADLAAIAGSGSSGQPTGILATSGIGAVVGGTNGAAPTWAHMVELESDVAVANADIGALGYLTNAKVRGKLKTTEKASSTAQFVWPDTMSDPGMGMVNGYRAAVSNQVPSNLTKGTASGVCSAILFGNWADLLIGEWGILDVTVENVTLADIGGMTVRAFLDMDVAVRHAASFAAMQDALTT